MNRKQREYFKQFDEQITEKPINELRQWLLEITGWTPALGDCELHFKEKGLGSQCLWSCRWHTGGRGIISSDSYFPLDRMTAVELMSEARDLIHMQLNYHGVRHPDIAFVEKELLPLVEAFDGGGAPQLREIRDKIRKCRGSYTEYVAPFDLPADTFMVLVRPGWGSRAEITAAMEKLRSDRIPVR